MIGDRAAQQTSWGWALRKLAGRPPLGFSGVLGDFRPLSDNVRGPEALALMGPAWLNHIAAPRNLWRPKPGPTRVPKCRYRVKFYASDVGPRKRRDIRVDPSGKPGQSVRKFAGLGGYKAGTVKSYTGSWKCQVRGLVCSIVALFLDVGNTAGYCRHGAPRFDFATG